MRLSAEADAGRKQAELVAQRARAEAASLRADVASARIAAAKLGAETKALHRRVEELTQAEDQRQQMVEALRVERDRLAQEVAQLHSQIAEAPPVRSSAAEGTAAPGRMKELESAVAALTRELSQMKRTMARGQAPAKSKGELLPSGATPRPSIQPAVMEVEPAPPPMAETAIVTVQRGETLWGIARRHRVSVAALKQANGLTRDVAEVGRKLIIPMTP